MAQTLRLLIKVSYVLSSTMLTLIGSFKDLGLITEQSTWLIDSGLYLVLMMMMLVLPCLSCFHCSW